MPSPLFSGNEPLHIAGATILPQHLWIFAITVLIIIANKIFFNFTIAGKAMLACAYNSQAASLVGINVKTMILLSFAISSAIGSMAGIIIAPLTMTAYDVGVMLGLKGFCAVIIGGMSSGLGTIIGGLLLGLLESLGAGYISASYKDAIAFIILLLILFVRPARLICDKGNGKSLVDTLNMTKEKREIIMFLIFTLAVMAVPFFLKGSYFMNVLVFIGINTMLAIGLNLLMGYAGQISLGHAAFFGLGAYVSGVLTTQYELNPWSALAVAACVNGGLAFVIGFPILKLRGAFPGDGDAGFRNHHVHCFQ